MFIKADIRDVSFNIDRNFKHFIVATSLLYLIYSIIHYQEGDLHAYLPVYIVSAISYVFGYLYFRRTYNYVKASLILMLALSLVTFNAFIRGCIGNTGYIWSLVLIYLAYFFLPLKIANRFVFFYISLILGALILNFEGVLELPYKPAEILTMVIVILIVTYTSNVIMEDTISNITNLIGMANYDALTMLYNRRKLLQLLRYEFDNSLQMKKPLSVIMIDLDNFKDLNDTYGHLFGDEVLKELADLLRNILRKEDIIGRMGGEEFLVVLPNTDEKEAYVVAEKIRKSIKEHFKAKYGIDVTASLGVLQVQEGCSLNDILRNVDMAMYEAKRLGKDRVIVCDRKKLFCQKQASKRKEEAQASPVFS